MLTLAIIFVLTFISLSLLFQGYTEKYAIAEAEKLVQDSLLTHRAIHKYINTVSRPEIYRLKKEGFLYDDYFSPKTMSFTYTARGIKDFLNKERKKVGLTEIYFKLASSNPRNEINRADKQESELLKQMNNDEVENYKEIIEDKKGNHFLYIAIPTNPIKKGCLKCHGEPLDAPKEMVELYPESSGYHEEIGDIRALISIRIPLEQHMKDGRKISTTFILITFLALLFIYLLIWYFIYRINQQQLVILDKNKELEHLSTHDPLTGLPNRRYFEDYAKDKIAQGQRKNEKVAFLYIDLDGFKTINDDVSHQAGDLVLKTIAERFMGFVRQNELISRIGGDEFCMVVYGYNNITELEKIAERLIAKCTKTIITSGMEVSVGMSIGIAVYPDNGKTYNELISVADDTMYKVKKNKKGSYEFFK